MELLSTLFAPTTFYLFTTFVVIYFVHKWYSRRKYNFPPGPWSFPFIGKPSLAFGGGASELFAGEYRRKYGDVLQYYVGSNPVVVINDYDIAQEALTVKYPIVLSGRPYSQMSNNDIAFADYGPRWKEQRKIVHGALRKFALGGRIEPYVKHSFNVVVDYIAARNNFAPDAKEFKDLMYLLIYNVIAGFIYGKQYSMKDEEFLQLRKLFDDGNNLFMKYFYLEMLPCMEKWPLPPIQKFKNVTISLSKFMQTKIDEHRLKRTEELKDITDYILQEQESTPKDDVRSSYIQDVHVRQTLIDLFSAGTDTSAATLLWMIGILASYPDIQERLHKEIIDYAGDQQTDDDSDVTVEWRHHLPYTMATIQEILRYSCIVPNGLSHKALEDCKIGEFDVLKGTEIILNQYAYHFDPKYWEEPNEFRPERFLNVDNDGVELKKAGFAPFGMGRRSCVGEAVARMEIFLMMVMFVQKYRFIWSEENVDNVVGPDQKSPFFRLPADFKVKFEHR